MGRDKIVRLGISGVRKGPSNEQAMPNCCFVRWTILLFGYDLFHATVSITVGELRRIL